MANYVGMAIGINRYRFFPPLQFGQADAQALWQFWVGQGNLPSHRCLLLTDTSPTIGDLSTYPTKESILSWLEVGGEDSQPSGKWRWFFFSGYGVSWQEVDYLMPIDGNPQDIPGTGIPVRSLFASMQNSGSDNILVVLDINRSPGLQGGTPVGTQIVQLAEQMGIALVLSSQLNQFSQEATALGHGLFTAALLEALRYYHTDITLAELEGYLSDRLPELSQHHWRPIQTPMTVIPTQSLGQRIFPTAENSVVNQKMATATPRAFIPQARLDAEELVVADSRNGTASLVEKKLPVTSYQLPVTSHQSQPDCYQKPWWQPLLLWGGGAALVLAMMIAAVVLRNREAWVRQSVTETPAAKTSMAKSPPVVKVKVSPAALVNPSNQLTTASRQKSDPHRLQANLAALDQAKRLLQPNQASLFRQAITQIRNIQPGDPLYQQSRQEITRWSGVILDLAEGRANQGNFPEAIASAQMVPQDDPSVYAKAQQKIEQWEILTQQQRQNQGLIQAAKKQIQPNQANSYRRAIATLRKIPSGQPGYNTAQNLIEQWSRTIYLMAQSRAWRGNYQAAIQTAAFVPTGTTSSDAAQKAIAKWQQLRQ